MESLHVAAKLRGPPGQWGGGGGMHASKQQGACTLAAHIRGMARCTRPAALPRIYLRLAVQRVWIERRPDAEGPLSTQISIASESMHGCMCRNAGPNSEKTTCYMRRPCIGARIRFTERPLFNLAELSTRIMDDRRGISRGQRSLERLLSHTYR